MDDKDRDSLIILAISFSVSLVTVTALWAWCRLVNWLFTVPEQPQHKPLRCDGGIVDEQHGPFDESKLLAIPALTRCWNCLGTSCKNCNYKGYFSPEELKNDPSRN